MQNVLLVPAIAMSVLMQVSPMERFRQAERYDRMRVISDVVMGRVSASDAEVQEVLEVAMRDADSSIRRQAVGSIASILQLSAMPNVPPGQEWAIRLRPVAERLREHLEQLTNDSDVVVRREVWRGLIGPAVVAAGKGPLPLPVAERAGKLYDTDPHPSLRAEAVTTLAKSHHSPDPAVRKIALRILLSALRETDPFVVQAAGWSAIESKAPEALPLLVEQLKNPSHVGRMGAAVGLQGYGADARPYLPQMEEALTKEPEGPTRKTLEATIRRVREGRSPN